MSFTSKEKPWISREGDGPYLDHSGLILALTVMSHQENHPANNVVLHKLPSCKLNRSEPSNGGLLDVKVYTFSH